MFKFETPNHPKHFKMDYTFKLFSSLAIVILLLTPKLKAHESLIIGDDHNMFVTALDRELGLEAIFYGDSLKIIDLNIFKIIEARHLNYPEPFNISDLEAIYLKHKLYLFSTKGNEVFELVKDSVQRIDSSFPNKMQQGAYLFEYRGEAYRYGGYGFWSYRNFFTNYDIGTQGWEIILPEGSEEFPQGSGHGTIAQVIGDNCYVFGGEEVNLKSPIVSQPNKAFWVFHFKERKWEYLGVLNPSLLNANKMVIMDDHDQIIYLGQKDFMVLDLENNIVKTHNNNPFSINLYTESEDHRIYNYGYMGNYYLLFKLNSKDKTRSLYKRYKLYNKPSIATDVIYQSNETERNMAISALAILITLLLALAYKMQLKTNKKKNQIQILSGKLLYKQRILDLQPQQLDLMQLFIKSKELSSNEILISIGNDHLHHTQNMRNLHKLIDELNMKLRLLTDDTNDLIKEEKSNIDRRIKIYKINESYFG